MLKLLMHTVMCLCFPPLSLPSFSLLKIVPVCVQRVHQFECYNHITADWRFAKHVHCTNGKEWSSVIRPQARLIHGEIHGTIGADGRAADGRGRDTPLLEPCLAIQSEDRVVLQPDVNGAVLPERHRR